MKEFSITFAIGAAAVFALTVAAERILIPILRSHKLGQKILDIGPRWHKSKEGTPIMGGLGFILAALVVMAVFFVVRGVQGRGAEYIPLALTLGLAVGNGAIGFVDDYCKLVRKQNEGLTWKQKLFLQLALATAYVVVMSYTGNLSTAVNLPFTDKTLELGWGFYPHRGHHPCGRDQRRQHHRRRGRSCLGRDLCHRRVSCRLRVLRAGRTARRGVGNPCGRNARVFWFTTSTPQRSLWGTRDRFSSVLWSSVARS